MINKDTILTIQDVSCFGQCSITVALPILSACGVETAIMPTTILSTHTGGFKGFTFRDLTEDMPGIIDHWVSEGIKYKLIYTGYFGSIKQMEYSSYAINKVLADNGKVVIDPVMADNGKLYYGFDIEFVDKMREFIKRADVLLPNITEAAFLANLPYKEVYDIDYINEIIEKLREITDATIILKGISIKDEKIGIAVSEYLKDTDIIFCDKVDKNSHGTGDCFAAAFIGAYLNDKDIKSAVKIAGDFIVDCLLKTPDTHPYGVCFEKALFKLMQGIVNE